MYKQPVVSTLYAVLTMFSLGTSMTCLGLSFYIIVRSQQTANEVSVTHTVALVRRLQSQIVCYYMVGMFAFFVSLLLLFWMCAQMAFKACAPSAGELRRHTPRARGVSWQVRRPQQLGPAAGRAKR